MSWKQIERSREARLWLTQVIAPLAMIMMVPEVRTAVSKKATEVKESIKRKFKK